MSRSRMFDDDPLEMDPSPRTTIVGGRPSAPPSDPPPIPTGIQRLLGRAAVDSGFLKSLLARRGDVAASAGVDLTASERAILAAIPASTLERMAVSLPQARADRRAFLYEAAATAVVLLGGGVGGCDRPDERPTATAGISPEELPRPDHRQTALTGGVAPDLPPPSASGKAAPAPSLGPHGSTLPLTPPTSVPPDPRAPRMLSAGVRPDTPRGGS
jgi:hypothetical protein